MSHWLPHPGGLAGLAVHEQLPIFARRVVLLILHLYQSSLPFSLSSVNNATWKSQTVTVQTLPPTEERILSTTVIPSGMHHPPRHPPSPYLPGLSSITFHPNDTIYAVAGADGGVRIFGCKLKSTRKEEWELPVPLAGLRDANTVTPQTDEPSSP